MIIIFFTYKFYRTVLGNLIYIIVFLVHISREWNYIIFLLINNVNLNENKQIGSFIFPNMQLNNYTIVINV